MKKIYRGIILIIMIPLLALVVAAPALAGKSIENGSTGGGTASGKGLDLFNVIDFKFHQYPNGIGYGSCPVYTAPNTSAYRCANGKASCDTNAEMMVGGYDQTGWLLVRYGTNNGGVRVGYIPPNYVRGFNPDIERLKFSYIEETAKATIRVTDNPLSPNSAFATLDKGETYYILGKYTYYGNWWYIECTVDGKVARGFIDRDTVEVDSDYDVPPYSPFGTTQCGTVTILGEARIVRQNAGTEYNMVARVENGERYPVYDSKIGSNYRLWYYIFVDGVWGWIGEGVVRYSR